MANDDVHVYPVNNLKEHILESTDCPCNPTVKVEGASLIIVHNAWDKREIIEQANEVLYGEKSAGLSDE